MITGARGAADIEQPVTGIQAGAMKSQYEPLCDEVFDASVEAPPTQDNQLWRLDGQCPEQPGGVCRSWSKNSRQVRWRRFEHKQQQTGDVLAYILAFPTQFELNTDTRLGILAYWRLETGT